MLLLSLLLFLTNDEYLYCRLCEIDISFTSVACLQEFYLNSYTCQLLVRQHPDRINACYMDICFVAKKNNNIPKHH